MNLLDGEVKYHFSSTFFTVPRPEGVGKVSAKEVFDSRGRLPESFLSPDERPEEDDLLAVIYRLP